MTDNYIQLKKSDILKLGILDADGNPTGDYLEFDLLDTGLLLKYQELIERDEKNRKNLTNQLKLIDEREDISGKKLSGKKLLSKNEEDKLKALEDFFVEEQKIYDLFLGEGGTKKLLLNRRLNFRTMTEIDEIINEQIAPKLKINMDGIKEKIIEKYSMQANIKNKL